MTNINQEEWRDLISNDSSAVIIDCRSSLEWRRGIIKNSKLINLLNPNGFMNEAEKLDKEKNYYIYCRSGIRSITACQILESLGVKKTYNLLGGIMSWKGEIVSPSEINNTN